MGELKCLLALSSPLRRFGISVINVVMFLVFRIFDGMLSLSNLKSKLAFPFKEFFFYYMIGFFAYNDQILNLLKCKTFYLFFCFNKREAFNFSK